MTVRLKYPELSETVPTVITLEELEKGSLDLSGSISVVDSSGKEVVSISRLSEPLPVATCPCCGESFEVTD